MWLPYSSEVSVILRMRRRNKSVHVDANSFRKKHVKTRMQERKACWTVIILFLINFLNQNSTFIWLTGEFQALWSRHKVGEGCLWAASQRPWVTDATIKEQSLTDLQLCYNICWWKRPDARSHSAATNTARFIVTGHPPLILLWQKPSVRLRPHDVPLLLFLSARPTKGETHKRQIRELGFRWEKWSS